MAIYYLLIILNQWTEVTPKKLASDNLDSFEIDQRFISCAFLMLLRLRLILKGY